MTSQYQRANTQVNHLMILKYLAQGTMEWLHYIVVEGRSHIPNMLNIGLELLTVELLFQGNPANLPLPYTPISTERLLKTPLNEWGIDWDESVADHLLDGIFLESFSIDGIGELTRYLINRYDTSSEKEILNMAFYKALIEISYDFDQPNLKYSELREFLIRNPTVNGLKASKEIRNHYLFTHFTNNSDKFPFYIDLPSNLFESKDKILLCDYCQYPISPRGIRRHRNDSCRLNARSFSRITIKKQGLNVVLNKLDAFKIVHPIIHLFCTIPGLPEIDLYDELRKLLKDQPEKEVLLYPDFDKMDIGVILPQTSIGIDLKDYKNNRDLIREIKSDLEKNEQFKSEYWKKWDRIIYGIPDYRAQERYYLRDILDSLSPILPEKVKIQTSGEIIRDFGEEFQ